MTDLIEKALHRLGEQLGGRLSRAMTATPPQRQSGQSPSAACRALSRTAGPPKTSGRQFEPHAIVTCHCRCAAEATTGPVAPCAPGLLST
jgi:hypothetical protein